LTVRPPGGFRVLIVDDEAALRRVHAQVVSQTGYQVETDRALPGDIVLSPRRPRASLDVVGHRVDGGRATVLVGTRVGIAT
jgi:CheY-like chemotaxis protein